MNQHILELGMTISHFLVVNKLLRQTSRKFHRSIVINTSVRYRFFFYLSKLLFAREEVDVITAGKVVILLASALLLTVESVFASAIPFIESLP